MPPINTRVVAVRTGPSTGASTRMKMNDPPQIAASSVRRATSSFLTGALSSSRAHKRVLLQGKQRSLAVEAARVSGE